MGDPPRGQLRSTEPGEGMTGTAYLAPDFPDPRALFNALRVRPTYRITLRLGEIEHLFRHEPNTREGRMERLQVLGLFYFPLEHRQAATAYAACWEWVRQQTFIAAEDEAEADREVQRRLRDWVVEMGRLPEPAEDPANPNEHRNFRKIRIPGAYAFMDSNTPPRPNRDGRANYRFPFGADLYDMETRYYRDNPVLRRIPLVARVERQMAPGAEWEPAPNVSVYFQLVRPYDLPEFTTVGSVTQNYNRPPLRNTRMGTAGLGPARIVDREEANSNEDDPQLNNARNVRGGERGRGNLADGSDVADVIFRVQSTPGFNEAHTTPVARELPHPPYPVAERVRPSGQSHRHAVKALTNDQGEAGVIFMPSRCGGDRYRIRVYIGPPTLPSDGTDDAAVRVDTGTFVLWRSIRISRYIRQDVGTPAASLLAQANPLPYALMSADAYLDECDVTNIDAATGAYRNLGLPEADFDRIGDNANTFDGLKQQFAKAFCEIDTDSYLRGPETLTQDEWSAAMDQAIADGEVGRSRLSMNNLDVRRLLCREAGSPITVGNAVCHIPMRTAEDYNTGLPTAQQIALRSSGGPTTTWRNRIGRLFWEYLTPGFLRHITRNGHLPGLTILQGAMGCTWQLFGSNLGVEGNSGYALHYRGAFIWYGNAFYSPRINVSPPNGDTAWYDFTSNCCHELGHTLNREHAPGGGPGGVRAAEHDQHQHNICVMSYDNCEGQYCALCLFALRGWDASRVPRN
jgi:hypothetical protein